MARYILFEQEGTKKRKRVKDGFRWMCLLFGPFWFFSHGMVAKGLLWLIAAIAGAILLVGIGGVVVWIIAGFMASSAEQDTLKKSGWKCLGFEDEYIKNESESSQVISN